MLIDLFTVIAQIINFLVLVVALKFLLFDRVVAAMDEREARIASRLEDAAAREDQAREEAEELREKRQELADREEELMAEARDQARKRRTELLDEARGDVDEQRSRWLRSLEHEQRDLREEIHRRIQTEVLDLGRSVLTQVAGASLERAVVDRGLDEILASDEFTEALDAGRSESRKALVVRSSFALDDEIQSSVEDRLTELVDDLVLRFEVDDELVLGLEMQVGDRVVSWSAEDFLNRLERAESGIVGLLADELDDEEKGSAEQ